MSGINTMSLDSVANDIASTLAGDLEVLAAYLAQRDELDNDIKELKLRIRRQKEAIEALTGTELPIPEFDLEDKVEVKSNVIPFPSPPLPPVILPPRDTSRDCPSCVSQNSLHIVTFTTSKGKNVRLNKCSECQSEWPA